MTSKFETPKNLSYLLNSHTEMKYYERDRFELLSAYLDGEVTPLERQQVQEWLNTDSQTQELYQRLLKLRQGLQSLPTPEPVKPADLLVQSVFQKIEKRRRKRLVLWSGGAIAALVIGALTSLMSDNLTPVPQIAQSSAPVTVAETEAEPLMIAINQPIIEIPKAAVAYPVKPANNKQ